MGSHETFFTQRFIETKLIASSNVLGFEPLTSLFSMEVLVPWFVHEFDVASQLPLRQSTEKGGLSHHGAHRPAELLHQRRFSSDQFNALKSHLAHTVVDPWLVSCYG